MTETYAFSPSSWGITLAHGWKTLVFHDIWSKHTELEARVRSGDYFVELATILDSLQSTTITTGAAQQLVIFDTIIQDLLYLQTHYEIQRKTTK